MLSVPAGVKKQRGARLRKARERAGLTQDALAEKMQCARYSIVRWEGGDRDVGPVAFDLAAVLHVSADWLVNG